MAYLEFVSDAVIRQIVADVLAKGALATAAAEHNFHRNVVDPFAALFEMSCFNISEKDWHQRESQRQTQKTLANEIGLFHQRVLGAVSGWKM